MAKTKSESSKSAKEEKAIIDDVKKSDEAIVEKEAQEIVDEAKTETTDDKDEESSSGKTTKAGKHSAKAQREAAQEQARQERKAQKSDDADDKPKQKQNPPRSKFERKGKHYKKLAQQIDQNKQYSLTEALELAVKTSPSKFDATVELHINLGVDPKHADQNIRGTVVLPAGTGKTTRVAVFTDADDAAQLKKAGADIAGEEEVIKSIEKGQLDFDVLIASPKTMPKLGKYARVLGPKGLMPNPKSGTVTSDLVKAVQEAKAGRLEYRVDSTGIVHAGFGKVSFGKEKLVANAAALLGSIKSAKPASLKGVYVKAVYVTTSMGPSVKVNPAEV